MAAQKHVEKGLTNRLSRTCETQRESPKGADGNICTVAVGNDKVFGLGVPVEQGR